MDGLPASWVRAPVADLLTGIESGKSFKCDERPPLFDEVGVIKVSAVSWGEYRELESKTCLDIGRVNAELFVRSGDFLFSRANTQELVGACVIAGRTNLKVMLSDKILRFQFADAAMKPWLLNYLRSAEGRTQIESLASGNQESMRNIGQERIDQIQVPLPPRAEQTRIVEKLEELLSDLDAGVSELKAAQKKLGQYRQSLLKAAVEGALTAQWRAQHTPTETGAQLLERILKERRARWEAKQLAKFEEQGKAAPKDWRKQYREPVTPDTNNLPKLPERWTWATLDQLLASLTSGSRDWSPYYNRGKCVFVMAQNVRPWRPDLSFKQFVDPPENDRDRTRSAIQKDDLLLTIVGANTGQICRVDETLESHFVCQSVALLRLIDPRISEYVNAALNSEGHGQRQFRELNYGAGRPHLSFDQLEAVTIPLPPLDEQIELLGQVTDGLAAIEQTSSELNQLEVLSAAQRKNILKAAFSGQLVPQDPDDEPAAVLLERIRAERAAHAKAPKARRAAQERA